MSKTDWRCSAHFMGRIPHPNEEAFSAFMPVDRMAHLPGDGGLACVVVACRVEEVDHAKKWVAVGVRIASPVWHEELDAWVENTLLPRVEMALAELVDRDIPPILGSEWEKRAYYMKGLEETPEVFVRTLGVCTAVRFEYLAGMRRVEEEAAARAERARMSEERRLAQEAEQAQKFWNRAKAWSTVLFNLFLNWLLPPEKVASPSVTAAPVLPEDLWANKSERVMTAVLGACDPVMGSLLRRVTIYNPKIAEYLERKEGVRAGVSGTMRAHEAAVMQITRVGSEGKHNSMVFDLVRADGLTDGVEVPEPRINAPLGTYEVQFRPRKFPTPK